MATPITAIQKERKSEEQIKLEKLEELKSLVAENEDALSKTMKLIGELNGLGVFDAADSMLQAKEDIAKIALGQLSREPVVNLINTAMAAGGALSKADPELTGKLIESLVAGIEQGQHFLKEDQKVSIFALLKAINDPDINRAIGFGLQFLKGMGKALKD
ncbi:MULTISPECIES: DUF1641 domain-containing protein [Bacillus]|uniref:DUF1641 domain-containing protein n=1 Tax=Bacillus glycinifermentans TaxID=1664069 RepID=A0AAJ4D357_9BACI|nr:MULTISPECIES: DUF1641 domain-containing protein [Bacillus]KKB72795.1 hypothetical protein TH62_15525 [Bacillus sp. TH008]MDU0073269.1 DUF1641 domain-containing protein [Bacillus sp. IG6]MED8021069.1 DUF1641 domain-containing protein [Bacillus glycinifermentans]QAT66135.1 DUF1641 domain-containing protein [Bacillus glycinifermentans]WKB75843.1 DUF1641 domain-containing protein [Bacillus glycinifermentans]